MTLGGWLFDQIVLDLLVEQFKEKHPKARHLAITPHAIVSRVEQFKEKHPKARHLAITPTP